MIAVINGLPDHVVGIVAKGRVTEKECDEVLLPAIEDRMKRHKKIRLYYDLSCRFPGAGWENLSLSGVLPWERVAIVSDIAWMRHTVNVLRPLIPAEVRVFAASQAVEGLAWITAMG